LTGFFAITNTALRRKVNIGTYRIIIQSPTNLAGARDDIVYGIGGGGGGGEKPKALSVFFQLLSGVSHE
jgi:hypothetical protein